MGASDEWANDAPKRGRGWSCPLTLAGAVSSVVLTLYGLFVVASAALG